MTRILLSLCLVFWAAGAATAETPQERLVAALVADGYVIQQTERTWLGRLRIIAIKGDLRREVVINPGTGEVLRDIASAEGRDESGSDSGSAVASTRPNEDGTTTTLSGDGDTAVTPSGSGQGTGSIGISIDDGRTKDVLLPEAGVTQ